MDFEFLSRAKSDNINLSEYFSRTGNYFFDDNLISKIKLHREIDDNNLMNVISLVDDRRKLMLQLERIDYVLDLRFLKRLNKWFAFFNVNYINTTSIYSHTISVLIKAAEENTLFRTQTSHEFELSLSFYEHLFSSKIFLRLNDIEEASYLLQISLLFGKYPGMVNGSIKKSILALSDGIRFGSLNIVFEKLFCKYEIPHIFTDNLNKLSILELETLMHILQGNNIRSFVKLPIPISKKESYIFINELPNELNFKNNILERGIIASKLLVLTNVNNANKLAEFFSCSRIFECQHYIFYEDIDFWKQVFNFISNVSWGITNLRMQEYIDFFEHQKYSENPDYSLKGRTENSISLAIHEWHEEADYAKKLEYINLEWKGLKTTPFREVIEDDVFLIEEIVNGKELLNESEKLKHCVFSYIDSCAQGFTAIWSMKKEVDSFFQSYITIQVTGKNIVQIAGKRNRAVVSKEYNFIESWAKEMNFEIDYSLQLEEI
jgi:hypothetical protein